MSSWGVGTFAAQTRVPHPQFPEGGADEVAPARSFRPLTLGPQGKAGRQSLVTHLRYEHPICTVSTPCHER